MTWPAETQLSEVGIDWFSSVWWVGIDSSAGSSLEPLSPFFSSVVQSERKLWPTVEVLASFEFHSSMKASMFGEVLETQIEFVEGSVGLAVLGQVLHEFEACWVEGRGSHNQRAGYGCFHKCKILIIISI